MDACVFDAYNTDYTQVLKDMHVQINVADKYWSMPQVHKLLYIWSADMPSIDATAWKLNLSRF